MPSLAQPQVNWDTKPPAKTLSSIFSKKLKESSKPKKEEESVLRGLKEEANEPDISLCEGAHIEKKEDVDLLETSQDFPLQDWLAKKPQSPSELDEQGNFEEAKDMNPVSMVLNDSFSDSIRPPPPPTGFGLKRGTSKKVDVQKLKAMSPPGIFEPPRFDIENEDPLLEPEILKGVQMPQEPELEPDLDESLIGAEQSQIHDKTDLLDEIFSKNQFLNEKEQESTLKNYEESLYDENDDTFLINARKVYSSPIEESVERFDRIQSFRRGPPGLSEPDFESEITVSKAKTAQANKAALKQKELLETSFGKSQIKEEEEMDFYGAQMNPMDYPYGPMMIPHSYTWGPDSPPMGSYIYEGDLQYINVSFAETIAPEMYQEKMFRYIPGKLP